MSEPTVDETQTGTSPARQMLEALARASKEMTRKLNETSEIANKLNASLDNKINDALADISRQAELMVQAQLEGMSAEKESVLAELTALRQEELKVLQGLSKNLKDSLNEKLNEHLNSLKEDVKKHLAEFKTQLGQKETEVTQSVTILRMTSREKLGEQLEAVRNKARDEKKELENLKELQQTLMAQESTASVAKLVEHSNELKERLDKVGIAYVKSVDLTVEEIVKAQAEKIEQRVQTLSSVQEKARPQIQVQMDFVEKAPVTFSDSCRQLADMRLRMHESMVNNLALVYRTEIESLAQDTDDKIVTVRSQLYSLLRTYIDQYNDKAVALLNRFEKEARAAKPAKAENESVADELPQVDAFFDKIKKEVRKTSKDVLVAAGNTMEHGIAEFRSNLNSTSQSACGQVEASFNDCRKSVIEYARVYCEELDELSQKGDALEQLVAEARELHDAMNFDS